MGLFGLKVIKKRWTISGCDRWYDGVSHLKLAKASPYYAVFLLQGLGFYRQSATHLFMNDSKDTSTEKDELKCRPTKWFVWRAFMILLMLVIFLVLFLQDGLTGYREKNLQFYVYENFKSAGLQFQKMQDDSGFSESQWKQYSSSQQCEFPEDADAILPKDTSLPMAWPDSLAASYELMSTKGGQNGAIKLWEEYAAERKWDSEPMDHPMNAGKIREQFYAAGVTGVLSLITLYFLLRTLRRSISVDEEALYTQDGKRIPYVDMLRIDKRNWDTKGLALVYYNDAGVEKKAKLDGMVYGQFKEEDGAPAERLFCYLMEHFKGEVIEYIDEEESSADNPEKADGLSDDESKQA